MTISVKKYWVISYHLSFCSFFREFFALYAECAEKLEEDAKNTRDKSRSVEVITLSNYNF